MLECETCPQISANLKHNTDERKVQADVFASKLLGVIQGMEARGLSQREMIAELNLLGVKTAKGKEWSLIQLQRVIKRLTNITTC